MRKLKSLTAVLAAAVIFSGCSPDAVPTEPTPTTAAAAEEIKEEAVKEAGFLVSGSTLLDANGNFKCVNERTFGAAAKSMENGVESTDFVRQIIKYKSDNFLQLLNIYEVSLTFKVLKEVRFKDNNSWQFSNI